MAVNGFIGAVLSNWPKLALAGGLVALGAATAGAVKDLRGVPQALAQHDSTTRDLVTIHAALVEELKKQTALQRQSLCIQVAQLRHDDWTRCLVTTP